MILSIQKYAIHVSYRPGKELLIADTLSRAPLPELADDLTYEEYDINILHTLPISEKKLEEFKQSTKADHLASSSEVQEGWPKSKTKVPTPHWNFRSHITTASSSKEVESLFPSQCNPHAQVHPSLL